MGLKGRIGRESCGSGHHMARKAADAEWPGMADRCRWPAAINQPDSHPPSGVASLKTGYSSQALNGHRLE
jgi:hypothetical protein